jgi:hypothetical protein
MLGNINLFQNRALCDFSFQNRAPNGGVFWASFQNRAPFASPGAGNFQNRARMERWPGWTANRVRKELLGFAHGSGSSIRSSV